jgi:hypothetical protein
MYVAVLGDRDLGGRSGYNVRLIAFFSASHLLVGLESNRLRLPELVDPVRGIKD